MKRKRRPLSDRDWERYHRQEMSSRKKVREIMRRLAALWKTFPKV